MTWFEALTGAPEESPSQVRGLLRVEGTRLHSARNGRSWEIGELETPSLGQLRERVGDAPRDRRSNTVREVVADVQRLHADTRHAHALFQVASQFNLLEMVGPSVTPERGVGRYEGDHTQGPACAIAAGAGTIYRNYFAVEDGRVGQSADHQIDCLAELGASLGNTDQRLWRMVNGYALPSSQGLREVDQKLEHMDEPGRDRLRQALRIGLQWGTQVTLDGSSHLVSQAYCAALPVSYTEHPPEAWARFATLVLEASYEATLCAAILNAQRTGNHQVFLTLLGGGAFGNHPTWIVDAIRRALSRHRDQGLDVAIVSYGGSRPIVQRLVSELMSTDQP